MLSSGSLCALKESVKDPSTTLLYGSTNCQDVFNSVARHRLGWYVAIPGITHSRDMFDAATSSLSFSDSHLSNKWYQKKSRSNQRIAIVQSPMPFSASYRRLQGLARLVMAVRQLRYHCAAAHHASSRRDRYFSIQFSLETSGSVGKAAMWYRSKSA